MKKEWRPRLCGETSLQTDYIIEGLGDLEDAGYNDGYKAGLHKPVRFASLEAALLWLHGWAMGNTSTVYKLDPEDDRVLIWEVLPSGHKKVVWHFSGWHWNADEFAGLDQGRWPGHELSVYGECLAESDDGL